MRVLLLLVPISLVLLGLAIWAFVWAVRRGQFDDLDTPALDILTDDEDDRREARPAQPNPEPSSQRLRGDDDARPDLPDAETSTPHDERPGPRDAD
ncbi:MAG TPA: cbb3-type cytochrome oxidase assembly protein CcoS [Luteimonas sp.]|nr:cbb3-type cytochrome oxidase assembly protein CcoS [Luteimonas sp.]HRO28287.1 cbb3-type cytochrome oxidase assembly protein CcoS [Luteimonas sp.]HRP72058.1 cbb3-type cytochrome oxidase assembly protein CcoS [Luteimonas sp.]